MLSPWFHLGLYRFSRSREADKGKNKGKKTGQNEITPGGGTKGDGSRPGPPLFVMCVIQSLSGAVPARGQASLHPWCHMTFRQS